MLLVQIAFSAPLNQEINIEENKLELFELEAWKYERHLTVSVFLKHIRPPTPLLQMLFTFVCGPQLPVDKKRFKCSLLLCKCYWSVVGAF